MTDPSRDGWNAAQYTQASSLQEAMAAEVLALLDLRGDERVLDIGCGDGRITAQIADRVPRGAVLGIDPSPDMIAHAARVHAAGAARTNLRFETGDARRLAFDAAFDLVVSFNALHWVHVPDDALRGIARALKPAARAQLRMVTKDASTSVEEVAEATRRLPRWAPHFGTGFEDPYLRLTADAYAALAPAFGLEVTARQTQRKAWDFVTDAAFTAFCAAGFGAWTQHLPEAARAAFVADVIGAYRTAHAAPAAEASVFRFVQSDFALVRRLAA